MTNLVSDVRKKCLALLPVTPECHVQWVTTATSTRCRLQNRNGPRSAAARPPEPIPHLPRLQQRNAVLWRRAGALSELATQRTAPVSRLGLHVRANQALLLPLAWFSPCRQAICGTAAMARTPRSCRRCSRLLPSPLLGTEGRPRLAAGWLTTRRGNEPSFSHWLPAVDPSC